MSIELYTAKVVSHDNVVNFPKLKLYLALLWSRGSPYNCTYNSSYRVLEEVTDGDVTITEVRVEQTEDGSVDTTGYVLLLLLDGF